MARPTFNSFASVLKSAPPNTKAALDPSHAIVLDESCFMDKDLSGTLMGKIKDINALPNLYDLLEKEGFEMVNLSYLGGFWVLIDTGSSKSKENMIKHMGVLSWFSELVPADDSFVSDERLVWISVEGLPSKVWSKNAFSKIISPWGSLSDVDEADDPSLPYKKLCNSDLWSPEFSNYLSDSDSDKDASVDENLNHDCGNIDLNGDNVNDLDPDHVSESSFVNDYVAATSVNLSNNKDEKKASEDPFGIYDILNKKTASCGTKSDDPLFPPGFTPVVESVNHVGSKEDNIDQPSCESKSNKEGQSYTKSGNNLCCPSCWNFSGILCVWDPQVFRKDNVSISDSFVAIRGTWIPSSTKLLLISMYAPQDVSARRSLWEYIGHLIEQWVSEYVVRGDFNEVRYDHEMFGSIFNELGANTFNHFISSANLVDLPLEGYSFTWAHKSASKMSKLDRFLVFEGLLSIFPSLSAICLDRHLSDHRPILMHELMVDYGSSPFRMFSSWFSKQGFVKIVKDTWNNSIFKETNSIVLLKKKLQALKSVIRSWIKDQNLNSNAERSDIMKRLAVLDKSFDQGNATDDLVKDRSALLKDLHDINSRLAQLAIRGVFVDGNWIDDPTHVKAEFLNHFSNRFSKPSNSSIHLSSQMSNSLSQDQVENRERNVTYEEIQVASGWIVEPTNPGPQMDLPLTFSVDTGMLFMMTVVKAV
ncbi:RNA-directed DNA polymerase, eukaryota [Tanacetum coccineum]|uniref:RNA-directed DNA polymerase, eukaryota n=1 Tax=Tanacetum coccineum TaxID=301880 RepID=A0ABQ5CKA4_9ASTR